MSLETREENEPMRHVPSLEFIVDRIENQFGRQLEIMAASIDREADYARKAGAMTEVLAACRWIVRVAECASHTRLSLHSGQSVSDTVREHVAAALDALKKADAVNFRHRMPYHRFERSEAEAVYTSFTVIPFYLRRAIEATKTFDAAIYEKIFGYVTNHEEFLVPIAQ